MPEPTASAAPPEPAEPPEPAAGPSLAVIVPVFNEAGQIDQALDALRQHCDEAVAAFPGGVEVLVADGGSTDGTPAAARERLWPGARVLHVPRGRARQMNAGAAAARASVLLFLHVDTRLPAHGLTRVAEQLAQHPRRHWGRFDVRIGGRSRWFPVIAAMMNLRSSATGIATGDQALFVRRAAFDAVGGYPDQPLMEDIELSRRLKRLPDGHPLCLRDRVLTSGRRWESRGVWPTIVLMWRLRWRYWRGAAPEELARAYR